MNRIAKFIAVGAALLMPYAASCCQFDTDCNPGSKCAKRGGSLYGACVGGLNPGNDNDNQPVYAPLDTNGTYGNTCQFDTDCGPGSKCVKTSGIYGTCLKRGGY